MGGENREWRARVAGDALEASGAGATNCRSVQSGKPDVTTPLPGDRRRGDHAAKYETSIGLALNPDWVKMDHLTPDRDPNRVTLPGTPRSDRSTHDPAHPLYAIYGDDPRETAPEAIGRKSVEEIVRRLSEKVEDALAPSSN